MPANLMAQCNQGRNFIEYPGYLFSIYLFIKTVLKIKRKGEIKVGIKLIKISVIYLVISTVLAMHMSITENMTLSTVHSHISCLGWTMLALSGLVYHVFPELEKMVLSRVYFWLFNIFLPIMIIGVALYLYDQSAFVKVIISIGALPTSIAMLLFAINVLVGLKKRSTK